MFIFSKRKLQRTTVTGDKQLSNISKRNPSPLVPCLTHENTVLPHKNPVYENPLLHTETDHYDKDSKSLSNVWKGVYAPCF